MRKTQGFSGIQYPMNLQTHLIERGLTEKESAVYLVVLELGSAPAATIARRLMINRVTTYSILQKLIGQGIASVIMKGRTGWYSVLSPETMAYRLQEKYNRFEASLPEFAAIAHKLGTKPRMQYFEGIDGLKTIYEDVLIRGEDIRMFMGVDYIHPKFKQYIDEYFVPERAKRELFARVIAPKTDDMIHYQEVEKNVMREMILVDPELFNFTSEIIIYGKDTVAISLFSEDELAGMIVKSSNFVDALQSIFDVLRTSLGGCRK